MVACRSIPGTVAPNGADHRRSLQGYDELIMSYIESRRLLAPAGSCRWATPVSPARPADRRGSAGHWRHQLTGSGAVIEIQLRRPLSAAERTALEWAVSRYGDYLGADGHGGAGADGLMVDRRVRARVRTGRDGDSGPLLRPVGTETAASIAWRVAAPPGPDGAAVQSGTRPVPSPEGLRASAAEGPCSCGSGQGWRAGSAGSAGYQDRSLPPGQTEGHTAPFARRMVTVG